jgi:hypothetical protein
MCMKRDCYLNVGVRGGAMWPTGERTIRFGGYQLILRPSTADSEQSIHVNLREISMVDALTLINRFLSILSWCDDQPMENLYGWSGNPVPVSVPRECRAVSCSSDFPFYRNPETNGKASLALALFREARTVNSTPFEFLSYFKILNIFWKDRTELVEGQRRNPIVEGIRVTILVVKDERALSRLGVLRGTEPDVAKYLYESGRCAVAHAQAEPIVDPDDVSDLRRLSEDVHIVKAIAEYLIEMELRVSRSIFE